MATAQAAVADRFDIRLNRAFQEHAVELAEAAHLTGTPHLVEIRERAVLFTVPSKDRVRTHYVVADRAGSVWCENCPASARNLACCHCGAVIHYMRQMAKLVEGYNY